MKLLEIIKQVFRNDADNLHHLKVGNIFKNHNFPYRNYLVIYKVTKTSVFFYRGYIESKDKFGIMLDPYPYNESRWVFLDNIRRSEYLRVITGSCL